MTVNQLNNIIGDNSIYCVFQEGKIHKTTDPITFGHRISFKKRKYFYLISRSYHL